MSLPFDSTCLMCHLGRNLETARRYGDEVQTMAFARELMQLYIDASPEAPSPWYAPAAAELMDRFYGLTGDRYREEKEASNAFVLARMDQIREKVKSAPDPLLAGLQFSILGNYIDFSALQGEVSFEKLGEMLETALQMELDKETYVNLKGEFARGSRLLYLTDNAGEIGFDRIFAEVIHEHYPHLEITFCVRGEPTQNDATREDAAAVGVPFPVIGNGNRIPSTQIELLSPEARDAFEGADVIISKGQGNAETLLGCGYNVYYAFLVKCPRFIQRFQREKLTPMLVAERK